MAGLWKRLCFGGADDDGVEREPGGKSRIAPRPLSNASPDCFAAAYYLDAIPDRPMLGK
jgi:hypothetical protein